MIHIRFINRAFVLKGNSYTHLCQIFVWVWINVSFSFQVHVFVLAPEVAAHSVLHGNVSRNFKANEMQSRSMSYVPTCCNGIGNTSLYACIVISTIHGSKTINTTGVFTSVHSLTTNVVQPDLATS